MKPTFTQLFSLILALSLIVSIRGSAEPTPSETIVRVFNCANDPRTYSWAQGGACNAFLSTKGGVITVVGLTKAQIQSGKYNPIALSTWPRVQPFQSLEGQLIGIEDLGTGQVRVISQVTYESL